MRENRASGQGQSDVCTIHDVIRMSGDVPWRANCWNASTASSSIVMILFVPSNFAKLYCFSASFSL